jgi:hypothetical protein
MAEARKRRKAPSRKSPAGRQEPADTVQGPSHRADGPKCWLCSEPLAAGMVASVLGPGMFEVHQRCYEEAMRS